MAESLFGLTAGILTVKHDIITRWLSRFGSFRVLRRPVQFTINTLPNSLRESFATVTVSLNRLQLHVIIDVLPACL